MSEEPRHRCSRRCRQADPATARRCTCSCNGRYHGSEYRGPRQLDLEFTSPSESPVES